MVGLLHEIRNGLRDDGWNCQRAFQRFVKSRLVSWQRVSGRGFSVGVGQRIAVWWSDEKGVLILLFGFDRYFDHIHAASTGDQFQGVSRNYPVDEYPRELNNKVYLLKHFESYMLDRLLGDHSYTYEDRTLTRGMVFVTRYLRMKHVIVFRLSNDVLQVGQNSSEHQ